MRCICYGQNPPDLPQRLEVVNDQNQGYMVYWFDHLSKDCKYIMHGISDVCHWEFLHPGDSSIYRCEGICSVAIKETVDTYTRFMIRDAEDTRIPISQIIEEGDISPASAPRPYRPPGVPPQGYIPQRPSLPAGPQAIQITNDTGTAKTVYVYSPRCKETPLGRPFICAFRFIQPGKVMNANCPGDCYAAVFSTPDRLQVYPIQGTAPIALSTIYREGIRIARDEFLERLDSGRLIQ